jgi:hypothetical protein
VKLATKKKSEYEMTDIRLQVKKQKNVVRAQLVTWTISFCERIEGKPYIHFDAELNGLHFGAIGFLEVVEGRDI